MIHSQPRFDRVRKCLAVLCLLVLAAALPAACAFAEEAETAAVSDAAVVKNPKATDRLNLREEAKDGAKSIGRYYNGVQVTVLEETSKTWSKVSVGSGAGTLTGYMKTKFLAFGDKADKVKTATPMFVSTTASWDVYAAPDSEAESVGTFGFGKIVQILGINDKWWHVSVDGTTGFIKAGKSKMLGETIGIVNNTGKDDQLFMRVKPSQAAKAFGQYYNGVIVKVLSYPSKTWAKVEVAGEKGYMLRKYLQIGVMPGDAPTAIPTMTVSTTAESVSLLQKPSKNAAKQGDGKLENGASVQVLGVFKDWSYVKTDSMAGFIQTQYLK